MTKNYSLNTAILCGLLALAPATQAAAPSITTFDCPNGSFTEPSSINAAGQVTGQCDDAAGSHAFVKNGTMVTPLDTGTPNFATNGTGINASGTVAGDYNDGTSLGVKGFVYSNGVPTLFSILNSSLMETRSISTSGKVVGDYLDITTNSYRGFLYDSTTKTYSIIDAVVPGLWTQAVSINDSDQVTGSGDIHGFVYSAGTSTLFDAPNAVQTVPRSINKSGQVVGMYYDSSYVSHGFLYSGGTVTTIDIACPAVPPTTGVTDTDVWSINDSGQMAGYCTDALGLSHGFVQTGTAGTPTIFDVPGAASIGTVPRSINTSGQVAGWYTDSFGSTHGFVTSAIGGTVTPPATPSCTKPKGAKFTSGRGIVTEVGTNYVMVVNLRIDYASCTRMNYGVDAKAPAVHDRIEWEGYNETNGNVMSQTLSFN